MQYREDRKSKNKLSVLGFGGMRLPRDSQKTEQLLCRAIEAGVNYIDTAYLYGGNEQAIGAALAKNGLRDKLYLATKLPHHNCKSTADFDRFFDESRQRLQVSRIDYYLIHNLIDLAQWERMVALGIEDWIAAKRACGEIGQIGFSFHGQTGEFKKLIDAYDWDFCQIQYNYINTHYQAGTEGLHYAASKGLSVIVMEPLLGGKLASPPKDVERIFRTAKPDVSPVSWALNWLWDQPEVTVVLSGMNEFSQLDENLALANEAAAGMLPEQGQETITKAIEVFSKSYRVACTGCNYCMPCPQKVNIPACFTAYNTSFAVSWVSGVTMYITGSGVGSASMHFASDCIACGACEKKCPQHLPIPELLKRTRRRLELPGIKFLVTKFVYGGK
jgi:predicted aldo/keto reductase-like oxidoreductase